MRWRRSGVSSGVRDHPAVLAAARHRLPIESVPTTPIQVDGRELEAIRQFCRTDRLSGLLASSVRAGEIIIADDVDVGDQIELVNDDWHSALHSSVLLEALLVRVAERLDATSARWLLTKGPAVAHLDFPDAALRTFADVDLVIHPDDWNVVVSLLDGDRVHGPRAREFARRYGKGCTVVIDDMEVDLHRRFAVGRFGVRARMSELFEHTESITLADRVIPTLSSEFRLLHACYHACLGGEAELRAFRDVAQLALGTPAAMERAWVISEGWHGQAVVATAVQETWRRLRLPSGHPVVRRAELVEVSRADRRTLSVFARGDRFRRQSLTAVSVLPVREQPRFLYTASRLALEHRRRT